MANKKFTEAWSGTGGAQENNYTMSGNEVVPFTGDGGEDYAVPFNLFPRSTVVAPTGVAATDTANIQAAIDRKGLVIISLPGTYVINKTLFIDEGTSLYIGSSTTILLDAESRCNMIRNKQSAGLIQNFDADGNGTNVIFTEPGHGKKVGDWVTTASGKETDPGWETEAQVIAADDATWTIPLAQTGNPTDWLWVYHNYTRLAASAFVGDGTEVVVTEAGHTRQINDPVFMKSIVGGTGVFNGQYVVTAITPTTWTYEATGAGLPTGTALVMGQRNIAVACDGYLDGNLDNQTSGYAMNQVGVYFQGVGDLSFAGNINNINERGMAWASVTNGRIPFLTVRNALVSIQVEGFWDGLSINNVVHEGSDDCVAFTQTTPLPETPPPPSDYTHTASPFGIRDSDNLRVENIKGMPSLTMIKITGQFGYTMGDMVFNGVYGEVSHPTKSAIPIRIIDDHNLYGGAADRIQISNINVKQPDDTAFIVFNMSGGVTLFSLDSFVMPSCLYFALFQTVEQINQAQRVASIGKFFVEKFTQTGSMTGNWMQIGGDANNRGFEVTDMEVKSGNILLAPATRGIYMGDALVLLDNIYLGNLSVNDITAARSTIFFAHFFGKIDTLVMEDLRTRGTAQLYSAQANAVAVDNTVGIVIQANNCYFENLAGSVFDILSIYKFNIIASNIRASDTGAAILAMNGGNAVVRFIGKGIFHVNGSNNLVWGRASGADNFLAGTNGTLSVDCAEGPVDTNAFSNLAPVKGDQVYNTYTLGTLSEGISSWDGTQWVNMMDGTS